VEREIKKAIKEGSALIVYKSVVKSLKNGKKFKFIVLASNAPATIKNEVEYLAKLAGVKVVSYKANSVELGSICGKPFAIAVLGVLKG